MGMLAREQGLVGKPLSARNGGLVRRRAGRLVY